MPFDLTNFFKLERFFSLQPAIALATVYFLLKIFGALLVLALIIKIISKITKGDSFSKQLWHKYFVFLLTMSLSGLFLVWFRYERAYFLSARFWLLVWLIGFIVWLFYILKYQFKVMPQARAQLQKTQEFNKYLPKRK